jgi:hypothetical protein
VAEAAVAYLLSAPDRPTDPTAATQYDGSLMSALHIVTTLDPTGTASGREQLRAVIFDAQRPSVLRAALLDAWVGRQDDPGVSEALVTLLADNDATVRGRANAWLRTVRSDAVPALVAALRDGSDAVRLAVIAHGQAYGHFPAFEEAIAACAAEGSAEVRKASIELLMARLESGFRLASPDLLLARNQDPQGRRAAPNRPSGRALPSVGVR